MHMRGHLPDADSGEFCVHLMPYKAGKVKYHPGGCLLWDSYRRFWVWISALGS